jgi:DNA-nicking Smr family endonuclease
MRLKDFEALGQALQAREREAARTRARLRALEAAAQAERARHQRVQEEFALTVGRVHTVTPHGRAAIDRPRPAPEPRQRQLDEQAALKEAMSDEVDIESLLLTDDGLSFRRPGVGHDVVAKLRRGHWAIQTQIDLHGLRRDEAREALAAFVRESVRRGQRCLRVVHGKGHGSPGRQPVLKAKAQRWLAQCSEVIAFAQASGPQGGAGALIVLLAGSAARAG